ncbi:MAG: transcriptional repressor [Acidaminococcus sp.]|jgi:Fur family ferric uptake transcriptional regulator|nr:transcriptional repressor [Acidaminococcus sp.]MCI2115343.1 transcriptional repressor [Acidaminococcus sp.]MCI2117396.1 transcriptional repressor [Acidaminococcus sp.]
MTETLTADAIIRQYNLKLTTPRKQVLNLLLSRQEILTADEIYESLVSKGSTLNFSTVYRTLETFTDRKITEKVRIPGTRKSGFLLFTMSHTHNLICLGCHKVIPIHGCPLKTFNEELAKKTHFEIVGHDLTVFGYCEQCKAKKKTKE